MWKRKTTTSEGDDVAHQISRSRVIPEYEGMFSSRDDFVLGVLGLNIEIR